MKNRQMYFMLLMVSAIAVGFFIDRVWILVMVFNANVLLYFLNVVLGEK